MTLEGARKAMKGPAKDITRDAELLERLQRIRSELVEVRDGLNAGSGEQIVESATPSWEGAEEGAAGSRQMRDKAVTQIEGGDKPEGDDKPKRRAPRRRKSDEEKELFPFYEQSLF